MNTYGKIIVLVALIVYVISPLDLCPGPIDDLILVVMYHAMSSKQSQ